MPELTNKLLQQKVTARAKLFDTRCKGLYASVSPTSVTFSWKFSHQRYGAKQRTYPLGAFDEKAFDVDHARKAVGDLLVDLKAGVDIFAHKDKVDSQTKANGKTFNEVVTLYLEHLKEEMRQKDGSYKPRKKSWKNDQSYLKHASTAFGTRAIATIIDNDIAALVEKLGKRKQNKRLPESVRVSLSTLFKWAGRPRAGGKFVNANPVSNVAPVCERYEKTRALTVEELKVLWHGLDRPDLPYDRKTALAYKLVLATMLRPGEVCSARRDQIIEVEGAGRTYVMPTTKNGLPNAQPLNSLACEIVDELLAMESHGGGLFPEGDLGAAFERMWLSRCLRSDKKKGRVGICEFLGFTKKAVNGNTPFSPFSTHDLRRSAANLLRYTGRVPEHLVGMCLDHSNPLAAKVTGTYTPHDAILEAPLKKEHLDHLDGLLRAAIGPAPKSNVLPLKRAA